MNYSTSNETNATANVYPLGYNIYWTFIIPFIGLFGTAINLTSIISLTKMEVKNRMYKFMLANSATNCLYTFLCSFVFVLRCGYLCSTDKNSFAVVFYDMFFWEYLTSCLGLLISLNEIVMCLQRYSYIANLESFRFENFEVTFAIFVLASLLNYMSRLFSMKIIRVDNMYQLVNTSFRATTFGMTLEICASVVRGPLVLVIVVIINILTALKFVEMIKKKRSLKKLILNEGKSTFKSRLLCFFVRR